MADVTLVIKADNTNAVKGIKDVQKETQKLTTAQKETVKVPPPPILSIKEIEKSDEIFDNFFNDLEKEFRTWFGTSPELEKVVRIFVDYLEKAKIGGRR